MKQEWKSLSSVLLEAVDTIQKMNEEQDMRDEETVVIEPAGQESLLQVWLETGADKPVSDQRSRGVVDDAPQRHQCCEHCHHHTLLKTYSQLTIML